MSKMKRRKLFFILSVIFIATAPLLIAYSLGYTFDFSRGVFEQTGGIFLKSKESRLSIFLDGNLAKETSLFSRGAFLPSLPPGSYLVKIEKEGFQPWFKVALVEPSLVREFRDIILVPIALNPATTSREILATVLATSSPLLRVTAEKRGDLVVHRGNQKEVVAKNVLWYDITGSRIIFVDRSRFVARYDAETRITKIIGRGGFYFGEKPFQFITSPRGDTAIIDSSGGILLLDTADIMISLDGAVMHAAFDSRGDKLLLTKEQRAEVFWLQDNRYQPFQKRATAETILNANNPIQDAYWFFGDDAHVVLRTKDGIFITELDGRGGRNTAELVRGPTDAMTTHRDFPNAVFFQKNKSWFQVEF